MTPQTLVTEPTLHMVGEGILLGAFMVIKGLWDDRKTSKRTAATKKERNEELDTRLNSLRQVISLNHDNLKGDVQAVSTEVRDLKAYVIGPDGQNGLRGDMRELKGKVEGLLTREPPARRRGNTLP